ncbi:MAG: hypothetical protein VCB60_06635 [Alphaproteobacteria bacterium]
MAKRTNGDNFDEMSAIGIKSIELFGYREIAWLIVNTAEFRFGYVTLTLFFDHLLHSSIS